MSEKTKVVKDWTNAVYQGPAHESEVPNTLWRAVQRLNALIKESGADKVLGILRKGNAMWLLSEAVGKPRRGSIEYRLTYVDDEKGFRFTATKWEAIDTTVPVK